MVLRHLDTMKKKNIMKKIKIKEINEISVKTKDKLRKREKEAVQKGKKQQIETSSCVCRRKVPT